MHQGNSHNESLQTQHVMSDPNYSDVPVHDKHCISVTGVITQCDPLSTWNIRVQAQKRVRMMRRGGEAQRKKQRNILVRKRGTSSAYILETVYAANHGYSTFGKPSNWAIWVPLEP